MYRQTRGGFRGGGAGPPFLGKNWVAYIEKHWSVTGVGPLLGSQFAPTYENFWIRHWKQLFVHCWQHFFTFNKAKWSMLRYCLFMFHFNLYTVCQVITIVMHPLYNKKYINISNLVLKLFFFFFTFCLNLNLDSCLTQLKYLCPLTHR